MSSVFRTLFLTFLAVALLYFLNLGFVSVVPEVGPPTTALQTAPSADNSYSASLLASDMRALKDNLRRSKWVSKEVDYRGYESRIYNYFIQLAGQGFCQKVSRLRLFSDNTSNGFKSVGVCLDKQQTPAELSVIWKGEKAEVHIAGQDELYQVDLQTKQQTGS
jgi:hypothetical protein